MSKTFLDKNNNTLATVYETSEVVANPTLEGTEASLSGLKIGSTKYKVEGGAGGETKLYNHMLVAHVLDSCGDEQVIYIFVTNTSSDSFTMESFKQMYEDKGFATNEDTYWMPNVVTIQQNQFTNECPCLLGYDSSSDKFHAPKVDSGNWLTMVSITTQLVKEA